MATTFPFDQRRCAGDPRCTVRFFAGEGTRTPAVHLFRARGERRWRHPPCPRRCRCHHRSDLAFNFIAMDDVRAQMERDEIPDVVIMDTNYRHPPITSSSLCCGQISDRAAAPADSESTLTLMAVQPGARNLGQKNDANVFATILNNRLRHEPRSGPSSPTSVPGSRTSPVVVRHPYLRGFHRRRPAEPRRASHRRRPDGARGAPGTRPGFDNVEDFEDYLASSPRVTTRKPRRLRSMT